jgi:septum formation protein
MTQAANKFVLASGSPRRQSMLRQIGCKFIIDVPGIDESVLPDELACDYVKRLSREKARSVFQKKVNQESVILAADTTVLLEGNILGKPESKLEGMSMLESLSDTVHEVLTGVTIVSRRNTVTFYVSTEVTFAKLSSAEIQAYWETGEPLDKAGSYGLQGIGAMFVAEIRGSYTNVIGLPLAETIVHLREQGVACLGHKEFC